eukprot:PhF_6_TR26205/c0_g2_i2/m.37319
MGSTWVLTGGWGDTSALDFTKVRSIDLVAPEKGWYIRDNNQTILKDLSSGVAVVNDTGFAVMYPSNLTHGVSNEVVFFKAPEFKIAWQTPLVQVPPYRSHPYFVQRGNMVFLIWGIVGSQVGSDVWTFNCDTEKFSYVYDTNLNGIVPRTHGVAVLYKNLILIHGGVTNPSLIKMGLSDSSTAVNDLIAFDVHTHTFSNYPVRSSSKHRYLHAGIMYNNVLIVFGGVANGGWATDVEVFDPISNLWSVMTSSKSSSFTPAFFAGGYVTRFNTSLVFLFGTDRIFNTTDRFMMTDINVEGLTFTWKKLPVQTADARYDIRNTKSVGGVGAWHFVCGGSGEYGNIYAVFPDLQCGAANIVTGETKGIPAPDVSMAHSSASFYRNKIYFFGGQQIIQGLLTNFRGNGLHTLVIPTRGMCGEGVSPFDDPQCTHCSPGTLNPLCVPAPLGTYAPDPWSPAIPCPEGTYGLYEGAASGDVCEVCPAGTYNPRVGAAGCNPCPTGMLCPVGSKNPLAGRANSSQEYVRQPPEYSTEDIPPVIVGGVVIAVTGPILLFSLLLYLSSHLKSRRLSYYFTAENQETLRNVFVSSCGPTQCRLGAGRLFIAVKSGPWEVQHLDEEDIERLITRHDSSGTRTLGLRDFIWCMVDLCEQGKVHPMEGSNAHQGIEPPRKWTFENFRIHK